MSSIIRGLIEADSELREAERSRGRSHRRYAEQSAPGSASRMRSTSKESSRSTGLTNPTGTPNAAERRQHREDYRVSTSIAYSSASAMATDALTETFLTSRRHPEPLVRPDDRRAALGQMPSSHSRSGAQAPTGSYSLPTANNSSGGSFLRVARNTPR